MEGKRLNEKHFHLTTATEARESDSKHAAPKEGTSEAAAPQHKECFLRSQEPTPRRICTGRHRGEEKYLLGGLDESMESCILTDGSRGANSLDLSGEFTVGLK